MSDRPPSARTTLWLMIRLLALMAGLAAFRLAGRIVLRDPGAWRAFLPLCRLADGIARDARPYPFETPPFLVEMARTWRLWRVVRPQ